MLHNFYCQALFFWLGWHWRALDNKSSKALGKNVKIKNDYKKQRQKMKCTGWWWQRQECNKAERAA